MECCSSDEDDSDFEDETPLRHQEDDKVYAKVLSRVCRRIKYFTREVDCISNYPLLLIQDAILVRKMERYPSNRF